MKKLLTVLMVTMVVLGLCTFAASAEQLVDVTINGVEVDFDVPAQVINDRTLVPLRGIFEVLGAQVNWDNDTETVTASKGDIEISLQIGSTSLFVNGEEKVIDVPPQLVSDRTLIPARAVAESFGATVDWDDANQTVIITDANCSDFKALLENAMADDEYNSVEMKMDINFGMTAEGEKVTLVANATAQAIEEPLSTKAEVAIDIMGEKVNSTVYLVEENGKHYAYAVAEADGEKEITKEEIEIPDYSNLELDLPVFADYAKIAAQEDVGEKKAAKYVFTVTGKQFNDLLKAVDTQGALAEAGLEGLFADDSELDMYLWVNIADGMAFKFNIDMVDTLTGILESMGVTEGVTFDACSIDIEITGIDTVEKITVPDDVKKNAILTTSME